MIQGSRDQLAFDQSPGLIAVFHALHRLLVPRHPPHALRSLTALTPPPRVNSPPLTRETRLRDVRQGQTEIAARYRLSKTVAYASGSDNLE